MFFGIFPQNTNNKGKKHSAPAYDVVLVSMGTKSINSYTNCRVWHKEGGIISQWNKEGG